MCQKCNEALMAAASAASLLAKAAKDLYDINENSASSALAKAAAELFSTETGEPKTGETGDASTEDVAKAAGFPKGFYIDEKAGLVYFDGTLIGRVIAMPKTPQS